MLRKFNQRSAVRIQQNIYSLLTVEKAMFINQIGPTIPILKNNPMFIGIFCWLKCSDKFYQLHKGQQCSMANLIKAQSILAQLYIHPKELVYFCFKPW